MDQKNIKLSEVHFNTCLLTSSSKPQEFAVGTVFEKCPQKCAFRPAKNSDCALDYFMTNFPVE